MPVEWSYALIMIAAITAGAALSQRRKTRLNLSWRQRVCVGLGAFCGGMLGSKVPFALADPMGPLCVHAWLSDGKTILFGLVGGYIGVEIAKALTDVRIKTGDALSVPVAVSIGIGRLGCFVGGCCYGVPTSLPWGVDFGDRIRRHPTQIYESIFHLSAAVMLVWLERHDLFPRQRLKIYFIAYCVFRFVSETIRPEVRMVWGLTGYQMASVVLILALVWLWSHDRTANPDAISCPNTSV